MTILAGTGAFYLIRMRTPCDNGTHPSGGETPFVPTQVDMVADSRSSIVGSVRHGAVSALKTGHDRVHPRGWNTLIKIVRAFAATWACRCLDTPGACGETPPPSLMHSECHWSLHA